MTAQVDTPGVVEAVLFDFGGVMTTRVADSINAWLQSDGIEPASFSRVLRAWLSRDAPAGTPIHRLETGQLAADEFERILAAELTTRDGRPIAPEGLLARLFAGMSLDADMVALVRELRDLGLAVGLVSNSWGNDYPHDLLEELFEPVVISANVGLRKPCDEIYQLAVEHLGLPHERIAFVDDAEPNVEAARNLRLRSVRHLDAQRTRAQLARWVHALRAA